MKRSQALELPDSPAIYHLRYQLALMDQYEVTASFGSLVNEEVEPYHGLGVEVRVGGPGAGQHRIRGLGERVRPDVGLAQDLTPEALRLDAWATHRHGVQGGGRAIRAKGRAVHAARRLSRATTC